MREEWKRINLNLLMPREGREQFLTLQLYPQFGQELALPEARPAPHSLWLMEVSREG